MNPSLEISDNFTLEDIRKIRDDVGKRYTRPDGTIDWEGLNAECALGASKVRAKIMELKNLRTQQAI